MSWWSFTETLDLSLKSAKTAIDKSDYSCN